MSASDARPLVSIVTPAYNQARYLAETIESVLAQDYPNVEYIVLDDGSTDDTPRVLERFTGRIRWERHANMGQSGTLNKGWTMARGDILGYISSDDRLRENCISQLVAGLRDHPEAAVAYCDFALIDSVGRLYRTIVTEPYSEEGLIGDLVCYPGPGALFRRSVLEGTGGWNPSLRQVPDFDFWLRASRFGAFLRVNACLAEFRIHSTSASFRKVAAARSDEIIEVVSQFWGDREGDLKRRSRATAYLIAARSHLISGRYLTACRRVGQSFIVQPPQTFALRSLRMLAAGLLRALYYEKLRHLVQSKQRGR